MRLPEKEECNCINSSRRVFCWPSEWIPRILQ